MARTTAPLLSFGASGAIAKTQVYSHWKGRPYARRYVVPANPDTVEQGKTRNVFAWLNQVWKRVPGGFTDAWMLYASNLQITDRNAWLHANIGPLRPGSDLASVVLSPSAGGGITAQGVSATPGSGSLSVTVTAPTLPTGWTIDQAYMAAIRQQDPHSAQLYTVTLATDASSPYTQTLSGLTGSQVYIVGGWFRFTKPDGTKAYGQAVQITATPS